MTFEKADVVVVGSGFGGAVPAYYCAASGAKVVVLERGPRLTRFPHSLRLGEFTRAVDLVVGDGVAAVTGNCVGGSSVVYFGASLRAPSFVFERRCGTGRRVWPRAISRASLDPWYARVEQALPVEVPQWSQIAYSGGVFAAACSRAGRTCNPVPLAVDLKRCVNCNWMLAGCDFDAKRSMLLNYLPAAEAAGAEIRPLHEVQTLTRGDRYVVSYTVIDPDDYRKVVGIGAIEAKTVVLAAGAVATPPILQRSALDVPGAVGKYFSGNGDRVSIAVVDDKKLGMPYEGFAVGRPINTMSFDRLDPVQPEYERFSLQQIYFPAITNVLADTGFGDSARDARAKWASWLSVLAMTEDDNEGVFGPPAPSGSGLRLALSVVRSSLRYRPSSRTLRGWALADDEAKAILERGGLSTVKPWRDFAGSVTAHPLASCRIGDDPRTSALDDRHEVRGHPGLFVTDGSAVPTSLCVNPSLTIAALAERASRIIVESTGRPARDVPLPGKG
ncbi:GMC family oxidoreductase [Allokutzneria sp. A3M-2-11 16]|uniref:GMC family oxidoreductase N-terminal domain-containing protein n=1 Tax=Allokutzneria sp. A3M-2-11 16 TaxID=2962043 RepID=UPI0020B89EC6|nr:GMC family oxidoreductase [Allokutzneria sp. A3M-2-11 16]MCP3802635.1 GMC family oxidoreductase [Allokutzneria sp. A3M-2-11 16]